MANSRVRIVLDSHGNLKVGAGIGKNAQDQVLWHNKTGMDGVTIDFGGSSPFAQSTFGPINNNATAPSGPATTIGIFKYTVKLAGKPDLDPNVIVDD
ncbi:MAG: hypothetical protein LAO06_01265 [Acidobacteriia bacterium]|nr:hypothetical protein [Terriglobia bacterium]